MNLVAPKHHGGYSTYYVHSGLGQAEVGARVAQGEVIGYIGQSGWATGPHLHYEFHAHNQNRNPLTMVFPAAKPIPAPELPGFRRMAEPLAARLDLLRYGDATLFE
jgi:murein DD-endopeptidase MepM/ murein hydrolase activator NlpD